MGDVEDEDRPLTPAMISLLQTAADNCATSDKELADLLFITPKTVHTQFGRICARLGVHDRAAALLKAAQYGWITIPGSPGPWQPLKPDG